LYVQTLFIEHRYETCISWHLSNLHRLSLILCARSSPTEGDDIDDDQAVLRIDPSQPAGSRAQIISVTNPESEAFVDFLKDIEDPEKEMAEQADGFWCGSVDNGLEEEASEFDPVNFEVVSETPSEAIIRPHLGKLAELLMQSEETEDMSKKERKLMKKLMERVEGEITLSKPNAEMKGFRVTMTRPLKMMIVAKIKVMDVEQNCALAPNGFYHMSTLNMNVEGKALGTKFGQKMDIQISDLRLLP